MKRILVLFIFIVLQSVLLNAQNGNVTDSLKIELEVSNDIERISILNQLSELYKNSDPFKSYSYAREALRLSYLKKDPHGQIIAHGNIGAFFQYTAQYSKALENYFKVNKLFEELDGDSVLLIRNNNLLGEVYRDLEEYDKALEYYGIARELSKKAEELETLIVVNANIALTYIEQGDFNEALRISKSSLEISESRDYLFGTMISLFNIGLVNHQLGEFEDAIDCFNRLENMVEQYGEQIGAEFILGKIKLYYSLAESYYSLGNFKQAQEYALKSWNIANGPNYKIDFKMVNDFLYKYYLNRENHAEALKYFELSYALNDEIKSEVNNRQVLLLESLEEERKMAFAMNLELEKRDKKFRLEYIGISVVLLNIFLLALILGRYKLSQQIGKAIIFLSFLFLFEFALLLIDPPLDLHTSGEPVYKMLANSSLAIVFTFLHRFLEKKVAFN